MKRIVVCGDSFNFGIGCVNLYTQPYGVLVAEEFGFDLVRLARGSASNYITHLQAEYAAKMDPKPHLVIIGSTSYDRIEWVAENATDVPKHLGAEHINYSLYPPHHLPQPHHDTGMPFWFDGREEHHPIILSEQIGGIADYIETLKKYPNYEYYKRLHSEPRKKLQTMLDWCTNVMNHDIKSNYDIGVLLKSYMLVKKAGINCIVLTPDRRLQNLLPEQDYLNIDWFVLATQYEDKIESKHASEEGHAVVAKMLSEKIKTNGYD